MAIDLLAVRNTVFGHPRFAMGEIWYYPFDSTLTDAQAYAAFLADPIRELKVVTPKPDPDTGKTWVIRGAVADDGATWWIARNQAQAGQIGQINTYFDAAAGLTLESWLTNDAGVVSKVPLSYSQAGYARTGVINPDRPGGLPHYSALHQTIANGVYTARVVNVSFGTVLRQEVVSVTAAGPNQSLLSAPPAPSNQSTITSLTPSATRGAGLEGISFRGDGWECRFSFDFAADCTNIQTVLATASGGVVANAGLAETPNYQAVDTSFALQGNEQSSLRINGNTALPAPIQQGNNYLLGLKWTQNGTAFSYVQGVAPTPNNTLQVVSLAPLAGSGGGGNNTSDGFVDYNMNVRRAGLFASNNNRNPTTGGIPDYDANMVRWSVATSGYTPQTLCGKFNYFMSKINWRNMENSDQSFDYRYLDTSLALADEIQRPVILCFDMLIKLNEDPDSYLLAEDSMYDQEGRIIQQDNCRVACFSSAVARARHTRALAAMFAQIKASPYRKWVMAISVCNGLGTEHEFIRQNKVNGVQNIEVVTDYGPAEKAAFRLRAKAWYEVVQANHPQQYATALQAANARWSTNFSSWNDVQPPVPTGTSGENWNFNGSAFLRDWYNHRQLAMADYANMWHTQVKTELSTKVKTMLKFGNVHDSLSLSRGTATVIELLLHDVISIDNDPSYNLGFSNAVALGSNPVNRVVGDEVFQSYGGGYSQQTQIDWLKRTLGPGRAKIFDWAAYYVAGGGEFDEGKIQQARQWMKEVMDAVDAVYPIGELVSRPAPVGTITAQTSDILARTWRNAGGGNTSVEEQYNTMSQNGQLAVTVIANNNLTPA